MQLHWLVNVGLLVSATAFGRSQLPCDYPTREQCLSGDERIDSIDALAELLAGIQEVAAQQRMP